MQLRKKGLKKIQVCGIHTLRSTMPVRRSSQSQLKSERILSHGTDAGGNGSNHCHPKVYVVGKRSRFFFYPKQNQRRTLTGSGLFAFLESGKKSHFRLTCVSQKPLCLSSLIGNKSIRRLTLFLCLKREKIKLRHTPQQFLSSDVYFLRSFLALSCRLIPFEENTKTTKIRTTAYKEQRKCIAVKK